MHRSSLSTATSSSLTKEFTHNLTSRHAHPGTNPEFQGVIKFKSHRNNHRAQLTHSMPPEKLEIFKSLETWAKCWQPHDFLPDPKSDGFYDEISELRERCKEIPDEYLVILVGDMITEEAVPTYQTILTTLDDETGVSSSPWDAWTRAWSGEENRHGDLLSKYLYLSGRGSFTLTFQERATFISHGNTARLGKAHGDIKLAQISVLAFDDMIKKKITMHAYLMFDGQDDNLFENYSNVDQRLGVYIAKDLFIGENHFHFDLVNSVGE
ncbi:hypothetical protein MKW92_043143 [Papaver armeniacum]|nr:hypothetical protein MKW92_043143 [Papaver armeniacum]